jgi:hypothetical protein
MKKFYLSKRAIQLEQKTTGTRVVVEPFDPAVEKALNKLPPNLKNNVTKVVVHHEGGPGQFGHVETGPDKDPREIHVFKNRIIEWVKKMFGTTSPNMQQIEEATEAALTETLIHESIHIGPELTQEQILDPSFQFRGESETESKTKQTVQPLLYQHFPDLAQTMVRSSLMLNDIREKYLPNHTITEPDLEFVVYTVLGRKYNIVKKGIELIKDPNIYPVFNGIHKAVEFNKKVKFKYGKLLGIINYAIGNNCDSSDGVLSLACWQLQNGLNITGMLDKDTLISFGRHNHMSDKLPRNFGTVIPDLLYRGGIIDNLSQLSNLKDKFKIQRIISLHNHPMIGMMCKKIGIEHLPAPLEMGTPEEYGRKILGDKVSDLLKQKPTYIHCWFGADRTGGVIARFRTENGWTNKDAYLEAKSYGFKDMFADLIDWFSEIGDGPPPIDTGKIRKLYKKCPYKNPELEQDAQFVPPATPDDEPFSNPFDVTEKNTYQKNTDFVTNVNPYTSITPPISSGSTGI